MLKSQGFTHQELASALVDQMPSPGIVGEIDRKVDMVALERVLMEAPALNLF